MQINYILLGRESVRSAQRKALPKWSLQSELIVLLPI